MKGSPGAGGEALLGAGAFLVVEGGTNFAFAALTGERQRVQKTEV